MRQTFVNGQSFSWPPLMGHFMNRIDGVFDCRVDVVLADFYNQMGLPEYLHDGSIDAAQ